MDKELDEILRIIKRDPKNYSKTIRASQGLSEYVLSHSSSLDNKTYSFASRIYLVTSGKDVEPICEVCGKPLRKDIVSITLGFPHTCSKECRYKSKSRSDKTKATCLERYGVENPYQSNDVKSRIKKTMLERYGKASYAQTSEYKEKMKSVDRSSAILKCQKTMKEKRYQQLLDDKSVKPLFSLEDFLAERYYAMRVWDWECKKCGTRFKSTIDGNVYRDYRTYARCPKCLPVIKGWSQAEKDFTNFIKSFGIDLVEHDRTAIAPYELDVYVPSKNLAFEFDGLYWHSDINKPANYHLDKTKACAKKGIKLIHVFEDEWKYKMEITESRIKNLFGIYDKVVYARKCSVKETHPKDIKEFEDETHIQGHVPTIVNYGLYYEGKLVALMTFGVPRYDKSIEYELIRFSVAKGWHIPGAASKLFSHFIKDYKPNSVVSYCDLRWSQGNLYKTLGFKLMKTSKPNYFYVKSDRRESRQKYQKRCLPRIFGSSVDMTKTEEQIMSEHGYHKIYDCGNLVFHWTQNKIR